MNVPQEIKNSVSVLPSVVKQFFDHFAQQINERNKFPIELLTNTTSTYLQRINDDCLMKIFLRKPLTPLDLCSLAETCTRFQQISEHVFPKDIRICIRFDGNYDIVARNTWHSNYKAHDVERIFKNFGSTLSGISVESLCSLACEKQLNLLFNLVATYCVDTLESLKIHRLDIPEILTVKLYFRRLQQLELLNVTVRCGKTLFADLDSLIELRVDSVRNDNAVLENVFPKLKRVTVHWVDYQPFMTFISRHPSLKMLDLSLTDKMKTVDILQSVGNNCKELQELSLRMRNASSLLPLQALKSLKILKLHEASCEDLSFIPAMTKLRELEFLDDCILPTDSNQFASLNQLTKLHITLTYKSGSVDVFDLVRRLTNLEELTVSSSWNRFVLDEETFAEIVNVVKGRPNVLTLKCKCSFFYNSKKCDENQKVRLIRLYD